MRGARILIVDDENTVNHMIKSYIQREGFLTLSAYSGREALKIVREKSPDLVILNNALPDMSGVEACLEIRKTDNVPIMFLSHRSEETEKIVALSVGGDDYLTKPFSPGELTARIKALIRRQNYNRAEEYEDAKRVYRYPGLSIDMQTREVFVSGLPVYLTAKEFDVLAFLIEHPKCIYSAAQIFEQVWKSNAICNDARTVMVYISTLRKKIEFDPGNPKYILNIRRVGYKFNHRLLT